MDTDKVCWIIWKCEECNITWRRVGNVHHQFRQPKNGNHYTTPRTIWEYRA